MKQALTALLTILLLPLALPISVIIVALLLAMLAITSPALVLGGTLQAAGKLANLITDWMYPDQNKGVNYGNRPVFASLSMTVIFTPLLIVPVAVGEVVTAAILSVLLVPAMAVCGAYSVADKAINCFFAALSSKQEDSQIEHIYSKLPQDADDGRDGYYINSAELRDAPYFDSLFQQKMGKSNAEGTVEVVKNEVKNLTM